MSRSPLINVAEPIGRVVGRRAGSTDLPPTKRRTAGYGRAGIAYEQAAKDVVVLEVDGVPIAFASPRLLWRMKVVTGREKDAADLVFLRHWCAERGETPPGAQTIAG